VATGLPELFVLCETAGFTAGLLTFGLAVAVAVAGAGFAGTPVVSNLPIRESRSIY
jgi:hypothetical protein